MHSMNTHSCKTPSLLGVTLNNPYDHQTMPRDLCTSLLCVSKDAMQRYMKVQEHEHQRAWVCSWTLSYVTLPTTYSFLKRQLL